jgi:hypothetical protein
MKFDPHGDNEMRRLEPLILSASLLVALCLAGSSSALTVDCATAGCIGGVYTLDVVSTGVDTYQATYTIDTSGAFSVGATFLEDLNFKVANDYSNVLLLSGPTGGLVAGPLTGQGCGGNNGSFVCVELAPELTVGSAHTWEIQFQTTGLIAEDEWHVGARYTSETKRTGWVISETGSAPVPEPTAALLFGAGLLVASRATRRGR